MNLKQSWERAQTIDGWFSEENARGLYEYAKLSRQAIVEIGVYRGRSSTMLLGAAEEAKVPVYLIDNWKWDPARVTDEAGWAQAVENLRAIGPWNPVCIPLSPACEILRMDSSEAVAHVPGFDFIHIDGLHDQGRPDEDCRLWLPKLAAGGVACFHDFGHFPEVTEAVTVHTAGWEDLGVWESLAIRRKP